MAPTSVDDIYFAALKVLRALPKLVFCIVLWYYIFQAFWVLWMYPFETFRNVIAAVVGVIDAVLRVIAVVDFVATHPNLTLFLVFFVVPAVFSILGTIFMFCLRCLSFREQGVPHDSYTASYQLTNYDGNAPRDSTFSRLQSQGAGGGGGRYRAINGTGSPSWN